MLKEGLDGRAVYLIGILLESGHISGDSLSVAERAWRQMLQVEKEEGMRACIEHGRLTDAVKTIWASTSGNMKLRRIQQIIQVYAHPLRVLALGFSAGPRSE